MIELNTLEKMMKEVRENKDFLDSVSPNQFKSKQVLIKHVEDLQLVDQNSHIVIFGGWYGSILIPAFKYVDKITLIDKDPKVISIAKHRIFNEYKNIEFIADDVFSNFRDQFKQANLFINTSCEHMKPMKQWGPAPEYKNPWWDRVRPAYFAFQSNNMYDIPTHINCVSSIEEFKYQLPEKAEVMVEDRIRDERGTRFLLIGKL
tara:strand:- start:2596 stop:3207 length:612 start_codon:yes stop_codon:yes gene_type:complete